MSVGGCLYSTYTNSCVSLACSVVLSDGVLCRPSFMPAQSKRSPFFVWPNLSITTQRNELSMYYDDRCEKHDLKLGSQQATSQHMDALGHWALRFECKTCGKRFRTQDSADQHMRDTGHPKLQFKCETCNRRFGSQSSVNQHMSALDHYKRYYCYDCAKAYQDDNSLKMVCSARSPSY